MKSYELKPTYDNLLNTYLKDAIGRNNDIFLFANILNAIEDSCSIALDGQWGSGKTFFVKQVKLLLDAYNDFMATLDENDKLSIQNECKKHHGESNPEFQPQVCVYYDAWENDNDEEPILSLVYSILNSIKTDFTFKTNPECLKLSAEILEFFTGKNWAKLIDRFKGDSPLSGLEAAKNIEETIKEFLDSLLVEKGNRLIIFVDELDRCKPSYAVRLLERIKHYFSNDRITFVFSINSSELHHTIKRYYGNDFDACRYLNRFFYLRISLPPADLTKFYQNMEFNNSTYIYDIVCTAVIDTYNFSLRDILKYKMLARIAAHKPTHSNRYIQFGLVNNELMQFGLLYMVPIMIGLKMHDEKKYTAFINGSYSTPLKKIAYCLDEGFFTRLLSSKETFYAIEKGKVLTTVDEKLEEVYKKIFAIKQHDETSISIHEYNQIKNTLLRTAGLLSPYTDIDIE